MKFTALGATGAIGASCHLVQAAETGILLDAGLDPEDDGPEGLPRLDLIDDRTDAFVDHVVVTHAHHDHVGALPVIIKRYPHAQIHMTKPTRELAEFVLPASARLQRRRLREGSAAHEPLFSEEELDLHSYVYRSHDLKNEFDLTGFRNGGVVGASFYHAGHILGAAGVELTFRENGDERRVFYTGDTNLRPQCIMPAGDYPEGEVDVLIMESTLGADPDAETTTRRTEEKSLGEALRRVWDRGGTSLIPVFAVGRAQEILALIHRFKRRGVLPREVPVYTAGAMRAVSELYDRTRFISPRLNPDFQVYEVDQTRFPRGQAARNQAVTGPAIHVVSSGMMFERTLSNAVAQKLVGDEKNAVFLVGFAREDSPASRLLAAVEERNGTDTVDVVLDGRVGPQPVRCDVRRFRLSGHSHRRDLIRLVERMSPRAVVLVHGETKAREWMADNVNFFYPDVDVILPETGVTIEV